MSEIAEQEAPSRVAEPDAIEIAPDGVNPNTDGFVFRNMVVRMPAGSTADDLRDPKIWRRSQLKPHSSLRKYDHLFVLGNDESWYARAVVKEASSNAVHLLIEKVGGFRDADATLFSDGEFEVFWDGTAYGIRRMNDQVRVVPQGFTTEALAVAALRRECYPAKAA